MPPVSEDAEAETEAKAKLIQSFENIGLEETSVDEPVTYAKAQKREIPKRPAKSRQNSRKGKGKDGDTGGESEMKKKGDGLKLRLELNLDVEIELKATLKGELTLVLL